VISIYFGWVLKPADDLESANQFFSQLQKREDLDHENI
jgi:hypothetical protein